MTIDPQSFDPRRWSWITIGVFIAGLLVAALALFHRDQQTALPPPVAQAVERHALATAVDTAEIERLKRAADSARAKETVAIAKARNGDAAITRQASHADSAAQSAALAVSVSDSAIAWQRAYDARSAQALTVSVTSAQRDTALELAEVQVVSLDSALTRSEARATRADSVLGAVIKVAESRTPPCRIARFLPCPSRRAVMIGTAAVTALAVSGRIRIWTAGK